MDTEQEKDELIYEIEKIIDRKILEHERRVGWISGVLGILILGSLAYAIFHLYCLTIVF